MSRKQFNRKEARDVNKQSIDRKIQITENRTKQKKNVKKSKFCSSQENVHSIITMS